MIADDILAQAKTAGINPTGRRGCDFSTSLETLKWAGARHAIADGARDFKLEVIRLDTIPAGFLRASTHVKLRGPENRVWLFIEALSRSLRQYELDGAEPLRVASPKASWTARLRRWVFA